MYWTIAKKEVLSNLLNFRFVSGFILCFALTLISAWIVTQDYTERVANYSDAAQRHEEQLKDAKVFSEVKVTLDKRPEPLGLFCVGVEKQPGNTVTISHGEAPNSSASAEQQSNPLLAGFPSLDLSLIVQVVFSLLVLLFVYDSISGEKEHGTLSLILANAVPRHQVLLGKYLGIFLSLFVPILASILAVIAIIILSPSVDFSSSDWIRLGLISFVSLLYISAFCNMGFFVSSMTGRSTTSAMFLLLTWVMFILLIPRGSDYIASYVRPVTSQDLINARIDTLWDEYHEKVQRFYATHPVPDDGMAWWEYGDYYRDRKFWIGERRLMMPYLELYTGTGLHCFESFYLQVKKFRNEWQQWILSEDKKDKDSFHILSDEKWIPPFSRKKVDFGHLPSFSEKPIPLADAIQSGILDGVLLMLFNLIFFMGAYVAFLRYDVR